MPTSHLPGFTLTDHTFTVPLDYARPNGETIDVYAREVVATGREQAALPWLVFFQGGPGGPSPRPPAGGWLNRAVKDYRVLLLDQRGTGSSTPLTFQTLARFTSGQAMADYLSFFRQDGIIQDAEFIRRQLLGPKGKWSALGQSYGGFCITHYLSVAPEGLAEAFITGGLPPLTRPIDDIYRATYRRVLDKNQLYFERYPDDQAKAQAVMEYLSTHDAKLPTGDRLTPRRFQQIGLSFGMSDGFEGLHYLLEEAWARTASGNELSYTFLRRYENTQTFDTNPLFAVLHEPIYCQGAASRWSAERIRAEYPMFNWSPGQPVYFTGEMIYPWMFDEFQHLRPMREATHILAEREDWPRLYYPEVLQQNTVPVAAAIYYNDMYVEHEFSAETAKTIRGLKAWVTSEHEHNGLRAEGDKVLGRLIGMVRGEI